MRSYSRNKKNDPSSRYSRMEEPWPDEKEESAVSGQTSDPFSEGYGVRDSVSRQASYGRPEGYYESGYDAAGSRTSSRDDTKVYNRGGRTGTRSSGAGYGTEGYSRDRRGTGAAGSASWHAAKSAQTYDTWDDPEYDDRYAGPDQYAGDTDRRGYADADRYSYRHDAREHYADRQDGRDRYPDGYDERVYAGSGRRSGRTRGRGRKGFAVKLILLIIAAVLLTAVWRFSRMERTSLTDILVNTGITAKDGYQDFVIYGVDSREGKLTEEAHSDTIIICSINKSSKEVKMVSVYRDTYLDNTNGEYRKATECYYFGGPERSVNMLNKNLDLDLRDYLTVDFNAVVKMVDLIGGVDVDVTEEELPYINGYQTENAEVTGAEITPVTSAGYQTLNGIQALAYCRIRYTAGSDYKRTERQRTVMTQIFEKAKQQGAVRVVQMIDTMLPYIATSFSNAELVSLASGISDLTLGESTGFPFELQAANISAGDCVVPVNLAQNVSELHAFLYGDTGYVASDTVQQISAQITAATGIG